MWTIRNYWSRSGIQTIHQQAARHRWRGGLRHTQPFVTSTEHFGTEPEVPVYFLVSVVCQPSVCDRQVSVHV